MQALLTVIVTWLSMNHTLPLVDELPRIELVSAEKMSDVRRERLVSALSKGLAAPRTAAPSPEPGVHAFYDDLERTIYLPEGWTASSPAQVSILVHELVHHLQNVDGASHACPEARERPAYQAQAAWLELHGTSLEEAFEIDAMTLLVRTRCLY